MMIIWVHSALQSGQAIKTAAGVQPSAAETFCATTAGPPLRLTTRAGTADPGGRVCRAHCKPSPGRARGAQFSFFPALTVPAFVLAGYLQLRYERCAS